MGAGAPGVWRHRGCGAARESGRPLPPSKGEGRSGSQGRAPPGHQPPATGNRQPATGYCRSFHAGFCGEEDEGDAEGVDETGDGASFCEVAVEEVDECSGGGDAGGGEGNIVPELSEGPVPVARTLVGSTGR